MGWQEVLKTNFTKIEPLLDFLEVEGALRGEILKGPRFPVNVPRRLAEKMAKNDLEDPLFLQFVPLRKELEEALGYVADPVCDQQFRATPKALKKYKGRALVLATGACAMHCRFCFRQNFPYEKETQGFADELAWLREDASIQEVILSGGDPLSLSGRRMGAILEELSQIPHVKRIRFHTRFPVGIPERIDAEFLSQLGKCPKQVFFVLHVNHARELDDEVMQALRSIGRLGIPLLSQSVLLHQVNDTEEALISLCERLIDGGILPYYLHLLDPVQGTRHFYVEEEKALALIQALQEALSGYGVPRLVREVAGALSKTPILHSFYGLKP